MRTAAEIETLLRVMRSQGCVELEEPDLRLKVPRDAKSIRPATETMFPGAVEKRPESYDPAAAPGAEDDEDVDPTEIEADEEDPETFLQKVAEAAKGRASKGRRR